jgi:20S proteasome alpha/beta subunit
MIYKDSCGATTTTTTNHVSRKKSIVLLASPHVTPTPLMEADGTARFCAIAPCIVAAHSGVGADGRVVLAAAQRMAVEHEYTFDEPIPISHFLEQTSLLFQEYTMKAGNRPFGCVLLIAHLPEDDDNDDGQPELYAIHPSGSVESLGQCGYIGAITDADSLLKDLESSISANTWNVTEAKQSLLDALQKDVQTSRTGRTLSGQEVTQENDALPKPAFLTASFTKHDGLKVNQIP